jgi:hypothetical protein
MANTVTTAEILPLPRSGRALAECRRARAVEMALAGYSYDDIATEVGYANRGTAWHVVAAALTRHTMESVENYRQIELARLEAILAAHWSAATCGTDLKAADLVTKVIAQRVKLLGIDGSPNDGQVAPRTIIVSSAPGEYVRDLMAIADDTSESVTRPLA